MTHYDAQKRGQEKRGPSAFYRPHVRSSVVLAKTGTLIPLFWPLLEGRDGCVDFLEGGGQGMGVLDEFVENEIGAILIELNTVFLQLISVSQGVGLAFFLGTIDGSAGLGLGHVDEVLEGFCEEFTRGEPAGEDFWPEGADEGAGDSGPVRGGECFEVVPDLAKEGVDQESEKFR